MELPQYPPQTDPIRATCPIGGWVIKKSGEGSHVIYASELDLKGSLPKFLVEKSADIQVQIVSALRDYMIKMEEQNPGAVVPKQYDEEEEDEEEKVPFEEVKRQPEPKKSLNTSPQQQAANVAVSQNVSISKSPKRESLQQEEEVSSIM